LAFDRTRLAARIVFPLARHFVEHLRLATPGADTAQLKEHHREAGSPASRCTGT
jgi:hypothetical protein